MVTADLILELAVVVTVVVVLLAIPRMMRADEETRDALHREQAMHRHARLRHVKHAA